MKAQDQKEIHASEVPLWRNRGFLLLWGSQAISSIGSGISEIAFPLLVLAFTHSPLDAGLVGALRVLPSLLFSLPGGVLVDRWSRKKVMLFCYIGRGANITTIPLALLFLRLTLAQLCIVAFIDGTLSIFFGLSSIAALPHVVPEGQLPDAVAQNEVGESVTVMVSPMLGGYLFGVLNALPFLFDLISYVLATAFLLFMHMDFQPTGRQQHTSFRKEMVEGVRWLWHRPLLRMMTLVVALQLLAVVGGDLGVIVLAQQQHASAVEIGLIFSAGGIGGILGALFAPFLRKRLPFVTLLLCTEWLLALFWFGYAFAPAILLLALLEAVVAVVDQIMDVVWVSYRIALIPSALQGRVNSIYRLVGQVSRPLGLFGAGVVLQKVGGGEMFLFTGLILVVAALGASVALGLNRSTI